MPNDPGPTSWDPAEYRRAMGQIQAAGTTEAARLARARTMVRVDRNEKPGIRVPAWDDIVHVGPRTTVTPEDRAIQRHFDRAKLPSPLAPDKQAELRRRQELAEHIRNSPIPEYQQGVTAALTAIDNVQDAALTASVAARVAVPATSTLGAWLAPAVGFLGVIGTALNWIAAAIFALGVAYTLACKGPREAFSQLSVPALAGFWFKGLRAILPRSRGIAHPTPGQARKGRMAAMMTSIPDGRTASRLNASRWARRGVSFAEAFQVAQTAYDVTGYGLSLGAVYGFTAETTYVATQSGRGAPVKPRSPLVNHVLQRILQPHIELLSDAAIWHRAQCCRALASAPFILRDPETFGDDLYALTWLTYYVSLEPLMWDTHGLQWREAVITALPGAWAPWEPQDLVTRDAVESIGLDPTAAGTWPIAGNPRELTSDQLVLELGPEMARALKRWLEAAPFDPLRRFVAELSMRVTERVWYFLEAARDVPRWELSPSAALWESIIMADRWPIISDDPRAIAAAIQNCFDYIERTGHKYIDVEVLDRIWADAGSPLLRITGGDGDQPGEHLVPWDEKTGAPGDVAFGTDVAQARARLEQLHQKTKEAPE